MLPLPVVLANRLALTLSSVRKAGLIPGLRPDGKTQVTVEYDEDGKPLRLDTVVISAQHSPSMEQDELLWQLTDKVLAPALHDFPPDEDTKILVNPSGRFVFGGPEADTGLTGRKLMVDSYGVFAPPWGWCVLRQRSHQGGPQRRLYGAVHCKEHCGGGSCQPM